METEELRQLMRGKSNGSLIMENEIELQKIRSSYLEKLQNTFDEIWNLEEQDISEEYQIWDRIEMLVTDTNFDIILGCNQYLDKIEQIFSKWQLCLGESKTYLIQLELSLHKLQKSYEQEFNSFCKSVNGTMNKKNSNKTDKDTRKEINMLLDAKIKSRSLFNKLKNAGLL